MNKLYTKVASLLASPTLRPAEVWAIRVAVAWVAVKLGVSVDHLVK